MEKFKIVIIGGGSVTWTPHFATDLFLTESLRGSRLVLVDVDAEAADLLRRYCRKLSEQIGTGWSVQVESLDAALDGADVVGVAISTGGLEAMHHDVSIPERFGIYHCVGDTVGPGGISRTLRNVPVFIDLARKMEKQCPKAWMVHVTNPLAQITRCVTKATNIRTVGLCHNYLGTRAFLANFLQCEREQVTATSVGVNHFTWLKHLAVCGQDAMPRMTLENYLAYEAAKQGKPLRTGSTEDNQPRPTGEAALNFHLNFELCEQFGIFPVGGASHVAENFPYYLSSAQTIRRHRLGRKGVLPERRDAQVKARQLLIDRIEDRSPMPEPEKTIEQLAPVMAALCAGDATQTVVNVPNIGQIANLPRGVVVETWANITYDRIDPIMAGDVPSPVAGPVQMIVQEEELAVDAALTGDRSKAVQAMLVSPMVTDKDRAAELTDALLEANAPWLPQFHHTTAH